MRLRLRLRFMIAVLGAMIALSCQNRSEKSPKKVKPLLENTSSNPETYSNVISQIMKQYDNDQIAADNITEHIQSEFQGKQFLNYWDIDHDNTKLHYHLLSQHGFLYNLKNKLGIAHITIELHKNGQILVEKLKNNEIEPRTFIAAMHLIAPIREENGSKRDKIECYVHLANLIKRGQRYGIEVHFVDQSDNERLLSNKTTSDFASALNERLIEMIESAPDYFNKNLETLDLQEYFRTQVDEITIDLFQKLTPDEQLKIQNYFSELSQSRESDTQRLKNDEALANEISEIVGSDKVLISMGAAHFSRTQGDLDAFLGHENCLSFSVARNGNTYDTFFSDIEYYHADYGLGPIQALELPFTVEL